MFERGIRIRFAAVVRQIVARRRSRITPERFARDGHDDIGNRHSADRRRDDGFSGREHFRNTPGRVRHFEIQRFTRRARRRKHDRNAQPLARIIRRIFDITNGLVGKIRILDRNGLKNRIGAAVVIDPEGPHSLRTGRDDIEGQIRRIGARIRGTAIVQNAEAQFRDASASGATIAAAATATTITSTAGIGPAASAIA